MLEYKSLTNLSYLAICVYRDKNNELTMTEIYELLGKHFLFGYEIWNNGKREGVAFAKQVGDAYTLDGYNEGKHFFGAVCGGRKVCKELFEKHTDVIWTAHPEKERLITLLAKRIGFKEIKRELGFVVLKLGK